MSETPNAIDAITAPVSSPGEKFFPKFEVTPELVAKAQELVALYPEGKEQSAVLPIIHHVQEEFGYISPEAMPWIAEMCKSTPIHVAGIVTFYPGIHRKCPGKFHFRVCRTIACALSGGEELLPYICSKMGVDPAEMTDEEPMVVSPDGLWSLEAVECLANCGFGPNVMVNDTLHSQVTRGKIDEIMAACKKELAAERKEAAAAKKEAAAARKEAKAAAAAAAETAAEVAETPTEETAEETATKKTAAKKPATKKAAPKKK